MKIEKYLTQDTNSPGNILVAGATGGTGRAVVKELLDAGHKVTAFSRSASSHFESTDRLDAIDGDIMNSADVERAVKGHDAVIVVLGISENPIRVRLFGTSHTPGDVRSMGTQKIIDAMHKFRISRLVVQSSYGVGDTRNNLGLIDQLFFSLLLKPQIKDTELQEQVVRASETDWVLVQPVHLIDGNESDNPYLSIDGKTRGMKVTRSAVARFLVVATQTSDFVGKTVSVSG